MHNNTPPTMLNTPDGLLDALRMERDSAKKDFLLLEHFKFKAGKNYVSRAKSYIKHLHNQNMTLKNIQNHVATVTNWVHTKTSKAQPECLLGVQALYRAIASPKIAYVEQQISQDVQFISTRMEAFREIGSSSKNSVTASTSAQTDYTTIRHSAKINFPAEIMQGMESEAQHAINAAWTQYDPNWRVTV